MPNLKDFYAQALVLPDNELLVVTYEISRRNIGRVQLSNSVKLLGKETTKDLKWMLKFIESYATKSYLIPCEP